MYGPLAQLGERQVRNLEVRGSIPLWSTKKYQIPQSLRLRDFSCFFACLSRFSGFIFLCFCQNRNAVNDAVERK